METIPLAEVVRLDGWIGLLGNGQEIAALESNVDETLLRLGTAAANILLAVAAEQVERAAGQEVAWGLKISTCGCLHQEDGNDSPRSPPEELPGQQVTACWLAAQVPA